ncbi:ABC transporter ATP-binding protein [Neobacillus sp. OS1-32]|uniref:ABC transporter ATP-binding protein n=1 Tax=Neobacillus sp. OS1-32 TaxID=3070682 RepID=UPI0027DEB48F|nr:ABC transporter ATP-binding protein [Neobacillus sp. OS1-32]WML29759.1 ABC transporter ATP-binding protein [Neobacillus sp. OS1-32]
MSILKVANIQKSYGRELVLNGVSFEINEPQIVALVGPNGSGKSTLLNILTNLLQADHGTVRILGKPNSDPKIFKEISFMQDNTVLYDYLTGYDHLQFIADIQSLPKERIIETARLIGIESYLHKKVKNYSLGMKQHLLLAMAIINQPKLLILDEPLNGLDPSSAIRVRELLLKLRKEGTTILLSSHNLGEIDRVTSSILFLKNGSLIKEDLSQLEETIYFISVDKTEKAKKMLLSCEIPIKVENNRLHISVKNHSLQQVIMLLIENGIKVVDIEKRIFGSEERYRQIYREKGMNDAVAYI